MVLAHPFIFLSLLTYIDSHSKISLYVLEEREGEVLFFNSHDDDLLPSLRLLYQLQAQHPSLQVLKTITVDTGAIKPLLGCSNIMRPGICSLGTDSFASGEYVVRQKDKFVNRLFDRLLKHKKRKAFWQLQRVSNPRRNCKQYGRGYFSNLSAN